MAFSEKILSIVKKNNFGFYELKDKPTNDQLKQYYSEIYYQKDKGSYQQEYSLEELQYFNNKLEQKFQIINEIISRAPQHSLLDIGCGEGFALQYFYQKGWTIQGLDYSVKGLQNHNAHLVERILVGDIQDNLEKLVEQAITYDVIWLDNVLEHVVDPEELLGKCKQIAHQHSVLVLEVPNDFSVIQEHLLNQNHVLNPYWIAIPDHISYFNRDGLIGLCTSAGWKPHKVLGDFPIDFDLFNSNTNYIENKVLGKASHLSRITIENIMHHISIDLTNQLYENLSQLGLGRQLVGFFKLE